MKKIQHVRFLRDCKASIEVRKQCGDGCCSWSEWEEWEFMKGDEEEASDVNVEHLDGGDDYEIFFR